LYWTAIRRKNIKPEPVKDGTERMKIVSGKAISALVLGAFLLSLLFTNTAYANNDPKIMYLVGTGILCTIDLSLCPDKATASSNGDIVTVTGSGSFETNPSDVTGGGSFVHTSSTGAVFGFGTWTAEELISWTPGGFSTLGGLLPAGSGEGGVAVLEVHLNPATGGAGFDAILTINCALATPGNPEGITLNVIGGPNFDTIAGGGTLFIALGTD
jgi:hypothetical protein